MAAKDRYIGSANGDLALPISVITRRAEAISARYTYECRALRLRLSRTGSPGTLTAKVYSGAGADEDNLLGTGTYDGDTVTTNYLGEMVQFDFGEGAEFSITYGSPYWIVLETPSNGDADNTINWRLNDNNPYAYGSLRYYYGSPVWGLEATKDHVFELRDDLYSSTTVYAEGTKTVTVAATVDYITGPGKAWNPGPEDDQEDIAIIGRIRINTLTWNAPANETPDYLVYYLVRGGSWVLQETITDDSTSHTLSSSVLAGLDYYSIYEWRVDTCAEGLTTTGDTWTFITQQEQFTDFTRRSDYDADKVWQPSTGWVDIDSFEYTGGGRFKGRVLVIGHKVLYFGDI